MVHRSQNENAPDAEAPEAEVWYSQLLLELVAQAQLDGALKVLVDHLSEGRCGWVDAIDVAPIRMIREVIEFRTEGYQLALAYPEVLE